MHEATESNEAAESEPAPWREGEQARVESWRLFVLLEAGFPAPIAERLATSETDLHACVALLERGCTPQTAAEILL